MRRRWFIRGLWLLIGVISAGGAAAWLGLLPWGRSSPPQGELPPTAQFETVPVQQAADFIADLQLSGKLALRTVRQIKAPFDEAVAHVDVEVGAQVKAGDVLVRLDRKELSAQLDTAWFELTKSRLALAKLVEPPSELEILQARAELMLTQDELDKLVNGPSAADINSASIAIKEAQAAYDELTARNDPNSTKVREARYALRQAQNELQRAQTAYDAVSWRGDLAALPESASLQSATISFESARTTFEEASKPPSELELQQAQLAIDKARNDYTKLFEQATAGGIEQARANVFKAEEKIGQILYGASTQDVQDAEVAVLEALTKLEDARLKLLQGSDLTAPIEGVVTKLAVTEGQVVKEGDTAAVVVAPKQFELLLTVDENSILALNEGMTAQITTDAAPDAIITGMVSYIAEVDSSSLEQAGSDSSSSSTTGSTEPARYPVTVDVDDATVPDFLRAGMSVQVTFLNSSQLAPNSWLVPANALTPVGDEQGTLQVLRGDTPETLTVTVTRQSQGEWIVVVSDQLQEGDLVIGSVSSFLGEDQFGPGGPGF